MSSNSFTAKAQEANNETAEKEFQNRLVSLGLTTEIAKILGITLIPLHEMAQEIGFMKGSGCIKIKYPGSDFCRYRFLGSFNGYKYHQKPGTEPHIYCPPNVLKTLSNKTIPLIITEGEFKGLSCQELPTLALGGVSSITCYHNNNKVLMEPLNSLPPGKTVYIAFDYDPVHPFDGEPKEEVAAAEARLAAMLYLRGLNVYLVRLGEYGLQHKVGLDDYLTSGGNIQIKLSQAKPFKPKKSDGLTYLLANYAVLQGDIVDIARYDLYSVPKFNNQEANCTNPYKPDANEKEPAPTKKFLMSPDRLALTGIAFDITSPAIITKNYELNTWRGIKTIPKLGKVSDAKDLEVIKQKVKPWTDFVDLFFEEDPVVKPYFEECMALMLQKPEVKQERICILMSKQQGIGKSFYFETMAAIINDSARGIPYGKFNHALVTSGGDLGDNFNSLIADKKLVVFNEIGEKGEKHTNLLKDLATGKSFTINEKYVKARSIANYLQICITTNETYTHIVEKNARREVIYCISESGQLAKDLKTFFATNTELRSWVNTPEARQALLDYYLNYDLNGYDGSQPAPMNASKDLFAEAVMHDVDFYIRDELHDVYYVVPKLEYARYINEGNNSRLSKSQFIIKLRAAGFGNGSFDTTRSQLNLSTNTTNKQLMRPTVLCRERYEYVDNKNRQEVCNYLSERYYPGMAIK